VYGPERKRGNEYVAAFDAARRGLPDGGKALRAAILTPAFPPIARATALVALGQHYTPSSIDALQAGVTDPDAIVRAAAARTLASLDAPDRVRLGRSLLTDPVRLVRAWAASALAGTSPGLLTPEEAASLARAADEYVALEMAVAERPEAHLNLSTFYLRQGKTREAEAALQTALRLDPRSVPARVNLADFYRAEGREADGERLLAEAVRLDPSAAEAMHALGLLYVRQGRRDESPHPARAAPTRCCPGPRVTATCMPSPCTMPAAPARPSPCSHRSMRPGPPMPTRWPHSPCSSGTAATCVRPRPGPRSWWRCGRTIQKRGNS